MDWSYLWHYTLLCALEEKKIICFNIHWTYKDVPEKVRPIRLLSKFLGISTKNEAKLNRKGIYSIGDLDHYPLTYLKQALGIIGEEMVCP